MPCSHVPCFCFPVAGFSDVLLPCSTIPLFPCSPYYQEEMASNAEVEGSLMAEANDMIAQNLIVEEEIQHDEVDEDEQL
jgi:hypothetical protein